MGYARKDVEKTKKLAKKNLYAIKKEQSFIALD